MKFLLYTLIPSGVVSYIPASTLRNPSVQGLLVSMLATSILVAVAVLVFYRGLRRYESGNLIGMNG